MNGYLVLADGRVFHGVGFGAATSALGEVVFNTGMTGYQEVLTDPSYYGQIVTMTYPLIGNYGINALDVESRSPYVRGFVVGRACQRPSHWQSERDLTDYLTAAGIPGLANIDTRALTRHLREQGSMSALIATLAAGPDGALASASPETIADWIAQARAFAIHDQAYAVTTPTVRRVPGAGHRVVVVDYGAKENIIRCLSERGCDLTIVPAATGADEILALRPEGIMLSNGPGDPAEYHELIATVRTLVTSGLPVFGICLGHQLQALALGGRTHKLKYGHHGSNHPVKDLVNGRVFITTQNHGYAADPATLPEDVIITHRNLNDGTVEGLMHRTLPVFSVQYHPEAAPGPEDNRYPFDRFLGLMDGMQPGNETQPGDGGEQHAQAQ